MTRRRQHRQRRDIERVMLELRRGDAQEAQLVYDAVRAEYAQQLRQRRSEQATTRTQSITQPARLRTRHVYSSIIMLALAELSVLWDGLLAALDAIGWLCCVTLPLIVYEQMCDGKA